MKGSRITRAWSCLLVTLWIMVQAGAAELSNDALARNIQAYKQDPRGPFQGIRWFCPDGSVRPARSPCGQPGGRQHALIKDEVEKLRADHHLFLGQILVANRFEQFWDAGQRNSRSKQYQMEKFLQAVDDGWIMRRARFYRGAFQIEGEEPWGRDFLVWLLGKNEVVQYCRGHLGQRPDRRSGVRERGLLRACAGELRDADRLEDSQFADGRQRGHDGAQRGGPAAGR